MTAARTPPSRYPLEGRRVLVTGGSSGIGEATARALSAAGAEVAILARRRERLEALAREIQAVAVPADLRDEQAACSAVEEAVHQLGGLDGVVNNAGLMRTAPIGEADVEDWRAMFDLNVVALLVVSQAALPHLRAAGRGDIVNLSSLSGRRVSNAAASVYAASKFAVHAVSEGLRREALADGIRVIVLAPGFVRTGLFDGTDDEAADRMRERAEAVGLSPEEVAGEVVHAMGLPPHVHLREVALSGLGQET